MTRRDRGGGRRRYEGEPGDGEARKKEGCEAREAKSRQGRGKIKNQRKKV